MDLLVSPGMWQIGMNGLTGVNWGALIPMLQGVDHHDRAAGVTRQAEAMVLRAYRLKAKASSQTSRDLERIRKTDPKAANLKNYDLIDLDNEVYANG